MGLSFGSTQSSAVFFSGSLTHFSAYVRELTPKCVRKEESLKRMTKLRDKSFSFFAPVIFFPAEKEVKCCGKKRPNHSAKRRPCFWVPRNHLMEHLIMINHFCANGQFQRKNAMWRCGLSLIGVGNVVQIKEKCTSLHRFFHIYLINNRHRSC